MSYSPKNCPAGANRTDAENHEKVVIEVTTYVEGKLTFVESVTRVVMTDEGKRYVTYKRQRYQLKKLRQHRGCYELRLLIQSKR